MPQTQYWLTRDSFVYEPGKGSSQKWTAWTHSCCEYTGIKNIKQTPKETALCVGGSPLNIPKDNSVLLRDHPEGRHKIQDNYKSELFMAVSKQIDP